jgi:hypothetical protein
VETRVLRERPRTQRGEHVRRRPRAAEQPEHGAPSPLALGGRARSGDAIGDDVDRPARRRGEHQRGDQHDRRRAHECGHERDCAEPRDDRVDRRRVAARSERDERTAHRDVADRAGREGKADRTRRHTVAMQPARGQQLSDAPERPGHDQRSGPREHAPVAQRADRAGPPAGRLRRRPTRLWRLPARPRRWRLGRRAGGQRERAAHDQAGGRDQGERKRAGRAGDEHPPERRADHRAHRGEDDRRADASPTAHLGEPRGAGGPEHPERQAVHGAADQKCGQRTARADSTGEDEHGA